MPSRPEKTVAMYQSEQADSYNQAVQILEERGEIDSDASEGEKLATLSRVAINKFDQQETTSQGSGSRIPWDKMFFALGIAGTVTVLMLLLGSVVFVVSQVLI